MYGGGQKIIDRIADFFTIFDFSFFISGMTTLVIVCYGLWETGLFFPFNHIFYNVAGFIVASYVCGLVSYVGGKWMRKKCIDHCKKMGKPRFMYCFTETMKYIKKEEYNEADYKDETYCKTYYTEMWMNLRQNEKAKETLAFLNKYWVFQAIYEGLMSSCLLGIVVGVILMSANGFYWPYIFFILICSLSFCICCMEATRYAETQIKEIVIANFTLK